MERTLSIIKPDAVEQGYTGAILEKIEGAGLKLLGLRMLCLSQKDAEAFYAVHAERPFYKSLVEFMTSGSVVVSALEGEDAIARYRELMAPPTPPMPPKARSASSTPATSSATPSMARMRQRLPPRRSPSSSKTPTSSAASASSQAPSCILPARG